jgi:carbon monoxide dehydrogenase subunit G
MKLEERFELAAPASRVWTVLNDVPLIAPHIPGFDLEAAEGDLYRGTMKVKLGALTVQYLTEITVAERDSDAMRVQMLVAGRERRGTGKMKAAVTSRLDDAGGHTIVTLDTDLDLAGKVAQMGRGMIADVSSKLVRDFVASLEADVLAGQPTDADPAEAGGVAVPPARTGESVVDLTGVAGKSAVKRLGPVIAALFVLGLWLRRRSR